MKNVDDLSTNYKLFDMTAEREQQLWKIINEIAKKSFILEQSDEHTKMIQVDFDCIGPLLIEKIPKQNERDFILCAWIVKSINDSIIRNKNFIGRT